MVNMYQIQSEQEAWAERNFGAKEERDADDPLIGIAEELGELCHAHLKNKQGIRTNEDHHRNKIDAIGDMLIYMLDYCNLHGICMEEALQNTWNEVKQRDWNKNKENGK